MIEKPPLAVQAAKASWVAPLVTIMLGLGTRVIASSNASPETARAIWLIVGAISVLIVVAGLVLGIVALFGINKHGVKGILIPSILGILLSSGWLYLLVNAIIHARRLMEEGPLPPQ